MQRALKMDRSLGQFYTVLADRILVGLQRPPPCARVVEPFAGQGDLVRWLGAGYTVEMYDIDPKTDGTTRQDTLASPPDYTDAWVVTNPPYFARNKCATKTLYDRYDTNDLYKCFLLSLGTAAAGGIIIIPVGFFLSPRAGDVRVRGMFLSAYRCIRVNYFEEQVFPDTTTCVVAIQFVRAPAPLAVQTIPWYRYPQGDHRVFCTDAQSRWIVGGDIYTLPTAQGVHVRRWVEGVPLVHGEQLTDLTLCALDGAGRVRLDCNPGYCYKAKESSRTYATLVLQGRVLTPAEQKSLADAFNALLERRRAETWSLFLPHYREGERKRIPFELAYQLVLHLLQ